MKRNHILIAVLGTIVFVLAGGSLAQEQLPYSWEKKEAPSAAQPETPASGQPQGSPAAQPQAPANSDVAKKDCDLYALNRRIDEVLDLIETVSEDIGSYSAKAEHIDTKSSPELQKNVDSMKHSIERMKSARHDLEKNESSSGSD